MRNKKIYCDHNASTPVHPKVLNAMLPFFTDQFGNASSSNHSWGWIAEQGVNIAREQIAKSVQAKASEIIFTSGATEAANLGIKGAFLQYSPYKGKQIICAASEHKAVLESCYYLEKFHGAIVHILALDINGLIDPKTLQLALEKEDTCLVCIMLANNETGVLQDVKNLATLCRNKGALFFCDCTQAVGKIPFSFDDLAVDMSCISAHKINGPKGVGALLLKKGVKIIAQQSGGGQENNLRSGTLNVPGIVGLGAATHDASAQQTTFYKHCVMLTKVFEVMLKGKIKINGHNASRLPNTSNICVPNINLATITKALPNVAFSNGSACSTALAVPSHVLKAMQLKDQEAFNSYRFSFGVENTIEEVEWIANQILHII